ncbi:MAG: nitrate/nitrite transporter NrtS [Oleiphilaceae bacterium]|nr:nitrate/nitrite transporter NrtS [Oleiphilaceae bacterium]
MASNHYRSSRNPEGAGVGKIRWRQALRLSVSDGTPRRSFGLALVVGTVLVLINQWEAWVGAGSFSWGKAILTYTVPYLVSTYTAVVKDLRTR